MSVCGWLSVVGFILATNDDSWVGIVALIASCIFGSIAIVQFAELKNRK